AVSRTDVVQDAPDAFYIYTDGDVPTQMIGWDGNLDTARRAYGNFIGALPYFLARTPVKSVMAIGAGGGLDVLLAKAGGADRIDAIEINPSIPSVVRDPRFSGTYARIYREPGVRLIVDEGRSFLQRAGKYDVVYFACAKTATTQTSGVALLDNHLYTVEAFQDYWHHLSENGVVALVTQESFLIDRLLITALTALQKEGLTLEEARNHLITARVPEAQFPNGPYRHILLLSRKAWKAEEMERVRTGIMRTGLEPLYLPHIQPRGAGLGTIRAGVSLAEIRTDLEHQYPLSPVPGAELANLSAVTDDSPFYVDVAHGLHPTIQSLLWGAGLATLAVGVAVLMFGLAPRRRTGGEEDAAPPVRFGRLAAWMLYFGMLGAGFMFVELALMQRFILLLGFPTRSLTVSLAALLLSSALGSWVTQRGSADDTAKRLVRLLPVLVVLLLGYRVALSPILAALLPLPLAVRILGTALLVLPAGFLMGMPFPSALRTLGPGYERLIPAFWSVNGVTSILGSVSAMALAKFIGYGGALVVGACCYAVAWGVAAVLSRARASRADSTEMTVSPR
ncbi:MAG: spermidine synthase, partial [Armatimonadetes bacterium]|nr:spermidine synthase [Armatimonadota bacterium]